MRNLTASYLTTLTNAAMQLGQMSIQPVHSKIHKVSARIGGLSTEVTRLDRTQVLLLADNLRLVAVLSKEVILNNCKKLNYYEIKYKLI